LRRITRQGERNDDDHYDCDDKSDDTTPLFPLSIVLDDPAGNSFLENPNAPTADPNMQSTRYFRTPTQDMALGLQPAVDDTIALHKNPVNAARGTHTIEFDKCTSSNDTSEFVREEAIKFQTPCPHCHKEAETDMCVTDIPHFKQVVIMCLLCEHCGYRSNEIKGGGAIPRFGTKVTLVVQDNDDLAREVLKSDTAGVAIPELELQLDEGGGEGVYTTVEGLLRKLHDQLRAANPFARGDSATKQHLEKNGGEFSAPSPNHVRYTQFLEKLKDCADGKSFSFTLVVSDPLSNSFVGPVPRDAIALSKQAEMDGNNDCYDTYVDKGMMIEEYERTHEQNETLGLNDIKTEHYQDGNGGTSFGTDSLQELPDRLCHLERSRPS
jgi:zinc finger protein